MARGAVTVDVAAADADFDIAAAFYQQLAAWDAEQSLRAGVPRELIDTLYYADAADPMGAYRAPRARLLIARRDGTAVGCVAFDAFEPHSAMLHRLFVDPAARGSGAGRALVEAAIVEAAALGYTRILLQTAVFMQHAIALYRSLGFVPCAPFLPVVPAVAHLDLSFERQL